MRNKFIITSLEQINELEEMIFHTTQKIYILLFRARW